MIVVDTVSSAIYFYLQHTQGKQALGCAEVRGASILKTRPMRRMVFVTAFGIISSVGYSCLDRR